jgi:hypothetical protein
MGVNALLVESDAEAIGYRGSARGNQASVLRPMGRVKGPILGKVQPNGLMQSRFSRRDRTLKVFVVLLPVASLYEFVKYGLRTGRHKAVRLAHERMHGTHKLVREHHESNANRGVEYSVEGAQVDDIPEAVVVGK